MQKKLSFIVFPVFIALFTIALTATLNLRHQSATFYSLTQNTAFQDVQAQDAAITNGKLNVNTATAQELEMLPEIGPALSQRIVDYRTDNGYFDSVDELTEVTGIGPKSIEKIRPYVTVGD